MKPKILIPAALAIVLPIAILTNPNSDNHKEKVRTELKKYFQQEMAEKQKSSDSADNEWAKAGEAFGTMFATALIDKLVDGAVTSDNYVLFSLTKVTWEGQEKNIGFGAFGNVWLSGKIKDLQQKQ